MTRMSLTLRRRLLHSAAGAAIVLAALPAAAQGFPQGGKVASSGAPVLTGGVYGQSGATITVQKPGATASIEVRPGAATRAIINWDSFDLAAGNTLNFSGPKGYAVLNRVATGPARIDGTINALTGIAGASTGAVWVLSPGGLLFGPQSVVNAGSFIGSTAALADSDFLAGGPYRFTGGTAGIDIASGARIAATGGPLLLVAPRVSSAGTLSAKSSDVVLVAAEDATVTLNATSLIGIDIRKGTPVSADAVVVGGGTVRGERVFLVAASPAADVTRPLLGVQGALVAELASASADGVVVLANAAATGTGYAVTMSDAAAADVALDGRVSAAGSGIRIAAAGDVDASQRIAAAGSVSIAAGGRAAATEALAVNALQIDAGPGGDIVLGIGEAGGAIALRAGRDVTASEVRSGDDLAVDAGRDARLTIADASGRGMRWDQAQGRPVRSGTAADPDGDGANLRVAAAGDATVGQGTARRSVTVTAGGGATATLDTATAFGDITLAGGTVRSATSLLATDDVRVVASAGDARLAAVRTTGLGPDSEGDGAQVNVRAARDATLGAVIATRGTMPRGDLTVAAGRSVLLASANIGDRVDLAGGTGSVEVTGRTNAGGAVRFDTAGGTDVRAGSIAAGGDLILRGGSGAVVVTGAAAAAGSLTLDATRGSDARIGTAVALGGDVQVLAGSGAAVIGGEAAASGNILVDAARGTDARIGSAATKTGDITVLAGSGEAAIAASASAGGAIRLDAAHGTDARLGSGAAKGGNLTLVAARDATVTESADASGDVAITAGRSAAAGSASAGGSVAVVAGLDATLGSGVAATDLTLTAGRDAASAVRLAGGDDVRVTAGRDAAVTLAEATGAAADREGDGANVMVSAGGGAAAQTARALRDVSVTAGTGTARLDQGEAGRDILLSGASAASATSLTAGDDVRVTATTGGAALAGLTAGGVALAYDPATGSFARSGKAVDSEGGVAAAHDVSVKAAGSAAMADVRAVRDVTLAAGGDLDAGAVRAGDDIRAAAGNGHAQLALAAADGSAADTEGDGSNLRIDAPRGLAGLAGGGSAPTSIAIASQDVAIGGPVASARVDLFVAGSPAAVTLGDNTPSAATPGWHLANAEVAQIRTPQLQIDTGGRNIEIGDATPDASVVRLAVISEKGVTPGGGAITVTGKLDLSGSGRTLTLGGSAADADNAARADLTRALADRVTVVAGSDAGAGGQLLAAAIRLRADYIAIGRDAPAAPTPFLAAVGALGSAIPTYGPGSAESDFFGDGTSSLFKAQPGYSSAGPYLAAERLVLMPGQWALLQNTRPDTKEGGGIAIGSAESKGSLTVLRGSATEPLIAVFGSISGFTGSAAAVRIDSIFFDEAEVAPTHFKINGCPALQAGGCIARQTFTLPNIALADTNDDLLVTSVPPLSVPVDLITGTANEALWRSREAQECDPGRPDAPGCKGGEEQR